MTVDTTSLLTMTSPAGDGVLVPTQLTAVEGISEAFRFDIEAYAASTIDPVSMLNQPACVAYNTSGATTRFFHGIVTEFGQTGRSGTIDTQYRLVLVPRLAASALQADCRMFFSKTADDILRAIFTDAGVTDVTFRLYGTPVARDATAQYNESSLHFATRLMEEEGWYYMFEHTATSHMLVVTDSNTGFQAITGAALRFGSGGGAGYTSDVLTSWQSLPALTLGQVSLADYDPDAPSKQLFAQKPTVLQYGGATNRQVFHWPALTRSTSQLSDRAELLMEAAEASVSLVHSSGAFGGLYAGGRFTVTDESGTQTPYVVQQVRHLAQDDKKRSATGAERYNNSFSAFPNSVPWRQPMTTPRPRMEGLHTAIVLGPAGDEIHTDDQARIKIRYFWDWRKDATADNAPFVRVVQPWAGNGWGAQFIPRVGMEVAVAFMDSDPDRPVVIGGLYNAADVPIFAVADKTKSGFRTRSTLNGGTDDFNEFSFDDDKGNEVVLLHAQKDLTTEVEHDETHTVDNDRTKTVKGKETVTITGNRAHEISQGDESLVIKQGKQSIEVDTGDQATLIKTGNQTVEIDTGDQTTTIKMGNQSVTLNLGNHAMEAKLGDITLKAGVGNITLQALQSITLKVGENTLTLSQTGVEVKGLMVTIQGQISTEVSGLMTKTSGTAMLTLKGGITMIN